MEAGAEAAPGVPRGWDIAALGLVLLLALAALWLSMRHPLWGDFQPGPGIFPAIAAGLAALCAAGAIAAALAEGRTLAPSTEPPAWRRLLVYGAIVLLWPASFASLGFVPSGLIALALLLRAGEGMSWPLALGFAAVTVFLGWLLFARLLGVPLPHGLLAA